MKQNWNIVHGPFALQMRFVFTLIWRKGEQSAAKWSSFKFVTARLEPGFWVVDALSLSAPLSQTPPLSAFCFVALRCEKSMRMVCAEFVVVISGVCVCGWEISRAANQQNLPFSLFFWAYAGSKFNVFSETKPKANWDTIAAIFDKERSCMILLRAENTPAR